MVQFLSPDSGLVIFAIHQLEGRQSNAGTCHNRSGTPSRASLAVSLSPRTIELASRQARARGVSLQAYLLLVLEQAVKAPTVTN
ncbi:MAG: hypothetical protein RIQ71_948 [Verrucomicrobiota bacterium]|jgi:hypothetical protein